MNRRTLFGRLLVAASAFVVAPAVTVEAAPLTATNDPTIDLRSYDAGYDQAIRELYAEGYERGRAVEQAKAESRAMLTFEAMQADCEAQNHMLWHMDFQDSTRRVWHDDDSMLVPEVFDPAHLARVDAWRRGLHAESGGTT